MSEQAAGRAAPAEDQSAAPTHGAARAERFVQLWRELDAPGLIKAMAAGEVPSAPHFDHMGLEVVDAEHGEVRLRWTPGEALLNPAGLVHGGYLSVVLDDATGLAAASAAERFLPMLTMDLRVDFVRPALAGVTHEVTGRLVHPGRTRRIADGQVHAPDGKLIARASGSFTPNKAFDPDADRRTRADG